MEAPISEQLQALLEMLTQAEAQAQHIKQQMRKQRLSFGVALNHFDDDIAQLRNRLQFLKSLAARHENSGAESAHPPDDEDSLPE